MKSYKYYIAHLDEDAKIPGRRTCIWECWFNDKFKEHFPVEGMVINSKELEKMFAKYGFEFLHNETGPAVKLLVGHKNAPHNETYFLNGERLGKEKWEKIIHNKNFNVKVENLVEGEE